MEEPDKPQITIWIAKATDAHPEYELLIALPRQQWLRERASMLFIRTLFLFFYIKYSFSP